MILRLQQTQQSYVRSCVERNRSSLAMKKLSNRELREYRLNPLDDVIEKQVIFVEAVHWVAALPDEFVPCNELGKSWRRWAFELSHLTFLNPHRTAGETYQIFQRLAY